MGRFAKIIRRISQHANIYKDFALNILASVIITGISQLVLYPWLAKVYNPQTYGLILTVMGIGNVFVTAVGNSINNVRLLMEEEYKKNKFKGDFLPIIAIASIVSAILMAVYIQTTSIAIDLIACILLCAYVIIGSLRGYAVVAYRLKLDFRGNLICCIAIGVGQVVGLIITVLAKNSSLWPLAFVLGEALAIPIIMKHSDILFEPYRITPLLGRTVKKLIALCATSLIANVLIYLDRIMLLPILGGDAVSTYTTASFFGKCLGILLTPMAGVLLGYYAQSGFSMTLEKFRKTNLVVLSGATLFYLVSLTLSKPITGLLYPSLIDSANDYLVIANLTAIVAAVGSMTQPAVLKFAPIRLQVYIQIGYCLIYLGGGYFGSQQGGLFGFSIAALVAVLMRLIALYILGEKHIAHNS